MKLRDYAKSIGLDVGCGDNSCIWGSPGGMATNGGCLCVDKEQEPDVLRREVRRMAKVARAALAEVERMRPVVEQMRSLLVSAWRWVPIGSGLGERIGAVLDAYEAALAGKEQG